ncbi:MAG: 6-carboxytetrahydropterin synthase [Planctomycetota bacterium]
MHERSGERYTVKLRKAVHVFSAGHFITLANDLCEALHGHNWTVAAAITGPPNPHGMVIDFIQFRDLLSGIIARLDHHMLLPTQNSLLHVATEQLASGRAEVTVRFKDRRWVFPAEECVLLPIANTTAEWLARWIGRELIGTLAAAGTHVSSGLAVEVDECLGQSAVWELIPHIQPE